MAGTKSKSKKPEQVKVKLVSTEELAKFVGVDVRRIQQLTQEGVIKKEPGDKKTSKYDYDRSVHSLLQFYRLKADSRTSTESKEMADEKLRQLAAKRELEEMKVKRARGELHHTEDIKRIFGAIFSRVHTGFESLPLGLAPKLVDLTNVMEIATEIKTQLDRILYEITNYDVDAIKKDIGAGYLAQLEAEDKAEND